MFTISIYSTPSSFNCSSFFLAATSLPLVFTFTWPCIAIALELAWHISTVMIKKIVKMRQFLFHRDKTGTLFSRLANLSVNVALLKKSYKIFEFRCKIFSNGTTASIYVAIDLSYECLAMWFILYTYGLKSTMKLLYVRFGML